MSLLNNSNKGKDKKKPGQPHAKPGMMVNKGSVNNKTSAKNTRVTGRAQRGS